MNLSLNFILEAFSTIQFITSENGITIESTIAKSGEIYIRKTIPLKTSLYNRLRELSSPNIPKIHFTAYDSNNTYVIEEYISGTSLETLCTIQNPSKEELKGYFLNICNILSNLHKNDIVHGNITASNIIIQNDGIIKLIGFDASVFDETKDRYGIIYEKTKDYYSLINAICRFLPPNKTILFKNILLIDNRNIPEEYELNTFTQLKATLQKI